MDIERYTQDSLEAIKDSDFLSPADWDALQAMQGELQDTFEKRQMWRTETEMRISVLSDMKFPTPSAKYWQAVREQNVFFQETVTLSFEYRRNNVKIQQLRQQIEAEEDALERKLLEIDLEEALFRKRHMEVAARNRVRELKLWSQIKDELEPLVVDTESPNTHQLVSYTRRFLQQAANLTEQTPVAERNNLLGQLQTALRWCEERGVLHEVNVERYLPSKEVRRIANLLKATRD